MENLEIQIENLRKADLASYKVLIDANFGNSSALAIYEESFDEDSLNYKVVVAKHDDVIVGSVTYYKINLFMWAKQPALELFNVCVLKDYRRHDIARKLFGHIIGVAKNEGYKSIYINCLKEAYGAHKLYESLGFKQDSTIKFTLDL